MPQTQTKNKPKDQPLFFPLNLQDWIVNSNKLTPAQLKVLYFIRALTGPWDNRMVEVSIQTMAEELHLDRSTVSRALKYLNQEKLIDLELVRVKTRAIYTTLKGHVGQDFQPKKTRECDRHAPERDHHAQECDRHAQPYIYDRARGLDLKNLRPQEGGEENFAENQEPTARLIASLQDQIETLKKETIMRKDSSSAATVEFHQKNISVETYEAPVKVCQEDITVEAHNAPVEFCQEDITIETYDTPVEICQEDIKVNTYNGSVNISQKHITVKNFPSELQHIPQELLEKVQTLQIPFTERVVGLLKQAHLSQIMGALSHVEATWEDIKSAEAVFVYQVQKKPVENLGTRMPVYTADDFNKVEAAPMPNSFKDMIANLAKKRSMR